MQIIAFTLILLVSLAARAQSGGALVTANDCKQARMVFIDTLIADVVAEVPDIDLAETRKDIASVAQKIIADVTRNPQPRELYVQEIKRFYAQLISPKLGEADAIKVRTALRSIELGLCHMDLNSRRRSTIPPVEKARLALALQAAESKRAQAAKPLKIEDAPKTPGGGAVHPEETERIAREVSRANEEHERNVQRSKENRERKQREKEAQELRELKEMTEALQRLSNTLKRR